MSMIIPEVIQIGDPLLQRPAQSAKKLNTKETRRVIHNLIDSMRHHQLVGMAANQIGERLRIFVTEIRKTPYRNPNDVDGLRVFINPKIVWKSKKQTVLYEGCGSVAYAKLFAPVKRSEKVIVKALDEQGVPFELKADGLLAKVIQHECDHLDNMEFLEYVTDNKTMISAGEYIKRINPKRN